MSRFPAWLWALLATAFLLYTDAYVIAGILPELADDLSVTVSQAGQLVTVFSLTVAVAAPVAAVVLARVPRRPLFAGGLLVFAAANLAAVVAPSFAALMGLRVLAALAAASLTPAIFAFAAEHAPKDAVGRYIATVSLGVTGSIAAGVPLGTWLGGHLGWRTTFAAMAVAGLVVLAAALVTLPRTHHADELPPLAEQVRTLRGPAISFGLLANCALMTGSMMVLTYLATYLGETTTAGVDERALAFGLAAMALLAWAGRSAVAPRSPGRA